MLTCIVNLFGVVTCLTLVNPSAKIIHVEPFERVSPAPTPAYIERAPAPVVESVPLPRPRPQGLGEFVSPLDRPHDTIQR